MRQQIPQVEHVPQPMRGAGDLVEQVTKRTGIKRLVDKVTGNRCGCGKRRDILNKLIPFRGEQDGVQSDTN
jgi:hypothetical protein